MNILEATKLFFTRYGGIYVPAAWRKLDAAEFAGIYLLCL